MDDTKTRIFPLGDAALTVEFGNVISPELNKIAIALADHFDANKFPGYVESVPAYASTTIYYEVIDVRRFFPNFPTAFEAVSHIARSALGNLDSVERGDERLIEIPVHFDADSALDIKIVAEHSGIGTDEVIRLFTGKTYRVYMLGFLPGFTYMGEVDERIAVPRKDSPRIAVPKGSVGIAGRQTGIYSLECPGGWQIVGRTDVELFTPNTEMPSYLQPGDEIRFVLVK